ncbi:hypothetical protein SAMN05216349_1548 [Oribacterium sp. KHPX15]|uniref:DUF434 domain-containing protein n=1 Tax=Oribacterium sp. KHPX15 TaxID=1855342 RepID=UPI00089BF587|nr:DUF434 domain-containing protein [Oribacterium sp. KHPX15]SEA92219.1 hypothetical protein SAMN05216349_1548 [Oribacterium sp. KHPX15]
MNAKRGYVPEDDMNFSEASIKDMRSASRHLCYLINEGYDLKQASTFVGNHFMYSERQRLALMRSVATKEQLEIRKGKEKSSIYGEEVWIDGFNTIITLEVMISDSILFLCQDGTIRDLAALRGTYRIIPETEKAIEILLGTLDDLGAENIHILLDEPVSNSGRLKSFIAEIADIYKIPLDIQVLKAVDKELLEKENVITSDSIILDHCKSWFNLMEKCVKDQNISPLQVWE